MDGDPIRPARLRLVRSTPSQADPVEQAASGILNSGLVACADGASYGADSGCLRPTGGRTPVRLFWNWKQAGYARFCGADHPPAIPVRHFFIVQQPDVLLGSSRNSPDARSPTGSPQPRDQRLKFRRSATVTSRSPSSGSIRASRRCAISPSEPKMCGCSPSNAVRRLLCDFASFTTDHVLFSAADNFLGTAIVHSRNLRTSVPSRYVVMARRGVTSAPASPGALLPQCGQCHATPGNVRIRVAARASHIPQG